MLIKRTTICLLAVIFAGCQSQIPRKNLWSGTIMLTGDKSLPFRMYLDLSSQKPFGYFLNGTERTEIPEIRLAGDSLSLIFSEYNSFMSGVWDGKEWRGRFIRCRTDTLKNDFVSMPGDFLKGKETDAPAGISLSGRYQAYIYEKNGIDSTTLATFSIKGDSIFGTLFAADGDYGLFAGTQNGSKASLSRFTGWQAFLLELEQQGSGWKGALYARSGDPMSFTLAPRPSSFPEPTAVHRSSVKKNVDHFQFSGISITGQKITSDDEFFKNKALIIDIMGTWCHNCLDATPVLQQLYSEFKKDGLEIVGLSFELTDDKELAKKNLTLFRERYGVSYTLLYCGSIKNAAADSDILKQIDDFYGYPTTIFIDKKGHVRNVQVGFMGPAAGEEYQAHVQKYYRVLSEILK